jgi:hypothetical protein
MLYDRRRTLEYAMDKAVAEINLWNVCTRNEAAEREAREALRKVS